MITILIWCLLITISSFYKNKLFPLSHLSIENGHIFSRSKIRAVNSRFWFNKPEGKAGNLTVQPNNTSPFDFHQK